MRLFIQELTVNRTISKFLSEEVSSVVYHNIFDYPLAFSELIKWRVGKKVKIKGEYFVKISNGFYYLGGREGIVFKRLLRKKISVKKIKIARRAAKLLSKIPTIKMVGLTGALAMENASDESDIDLMVITKGGSLWLTRLITLLTLDLLKIPRRRWKDKNQKDKICLNLWLDEEALSWRQKDRNIYIAHEIAQVVPLVNKERTYERFISENKWILNWWPSSVKIKKLKRVTSFASKNQNDKSKSKNFLHFALQFYILIFDFCIMVIEKVAFNLQLIYMKRKITGETVTPTRALFHPMNWSKIILQRLTGK